jgi:hypothetical protein
MAMSRSRRRPCARWPRSVQPPNGHHTKLARDAATGRFPCSRLQPWAVPA